jgi:hypothetical protein
LGDMHPFYPCTFLTNALKTNARAKINPTEFNRPYTAPALTREDFEVLRNFEM